MPPFGYERAGGEAVEEYEIGDILFRWDGGGYGLRRGAYMGRFACQKPRQGEVISLRASFEPLEPYTHCPKLGAGRLYEIYDAGGEPLLLYPWAGLRYAYGIWPGRIGAGRQDVCSFDPAILEQPPLDGDWFFGVCGLQKALLHRDRPVLHASYIDWKGSAVLFTAPSQTGKSTQAELWRDFAGAELINGDRVLLGKRNGVWQAYGYPNCGSSRVCINRTLPLRAVAVLEHGNENAVRPLTQAQKIRALTAGTVLYPWDAGDLDRAMRLAEEIAGSVPVLRLVCRPDRGAVEALRDFLEDMNDGKNQ